MTTLAIIPARSGSKSVPHKNIRLIGGKPMLAYSIEHAQQAQTIARIIVSTDSPHYAEIAQAHGAEVPFLRPSELAQDGSTDFEVFYHVLTWLRDHENYHPEIVVQLRPTYPIRNPQDIDAMVRILQDNPLIDSVRTVALSPDTPYKMWHRHDNGRLMPVMTQTMIPEAYNLPRQALPQVYLQNASIDVIRSRVILERQSMSGSYIHGYVMQENYDIDTEAQFQAALARIHQLQQDTQHE